MTYRNNETGEMYHGGTITRRLNNGAIITGIPTPELLDKWGFEPYTPPTHIPSEIDLKQQRMEDIRDELKETDYLALKAFEGEDMSEHPGWKERRAALRAEYRQLESEVQNV